MNPHYKRNTCLLSSAALSLVAACFAPVSMAQTTPDTWRITAGVGLINQPQYPGSRETETRVLPTISAGYGRYFIGGVPGAGIPAGVGVYLIQEENWRAGLGLGRNFEKPRKESDAARLRGLGDVDAATLGTLFASYTTQWFTARANLLTDIGGNDQGTRLSFDLEGKYRVNESLVLSAGPGLTWADNKYTQTFFGIDATQSANSGYGMFSAKSGINTVRFGIGANYQASPQWSLGAKFTAVNLRGDAARSPITEKKSQNTFAVFGSYSF